MSRTTAPKIRRSALIAVAAALLSGTAAGAAEAPAGAGLIETLVQRAVAGIDPGGKPQEALPADDADDAGSPPNRDDKAGALAMAARGTLPNLFPATVEDLLRDTTLAVTDFRGRRPVRATVERLLGKAARQPLQVIVTLKAQQAPEGLLGEAGARQQRGVNAHLQQRLLADLQPLLRGGSAKLGRRYQVVPMLALTVDARALALLADHVDVAAIDEDVQMKPSLIASSAAMGATDARDRGHVGNGQYVAVIDTGIARSAEFLSGFVAEACFLGSNGPKDSQCPNGENTQVGEGAAAACNFDTICDHGTHVSGIAIGSSVAGVTNLNGVARGAGLIPIQAYGRKVCGERTVGEWVEYDYCDGFNQSDVLAALEYVHELRSQYPIAAVNMSLGDDLRNTGNCDGSALKPIIDSLRSVNIATVISSGNEGYVDGVNHPACISSAITVGATTNSGAVASFSNIGPAALVDLVAPGVDIVSSCGSTSFCAKSGTSMAAPHVAGAIAAMQGQGTQTVNAIEQRLEATAFSRADQRTGGFQTSLRGLNLFDALAGEMPRTLLSSSSQRSYRTPRPIRHGYNYTATRRYWSVAALRQTTGVNLDLRQCASPFSDSCLYNGGSQSVPDVSKFDLELVAVDHNAGRRPVPDTIGLRITQASAGNPAVADDGRYGVQVSDASQVLVGSASTSFASAEIVKVYDHHVSAGVRTHVRAVHQTGINLYAFVSSSSDPSSHAQGPGSAALKLVSSRPGSVEGSFVPTSSGYAGLVIANRGGNGALTVFADSSAPTGSLTINGGAASTGNPQVQLNLSVSDAQTGLDDLRVSLDGGSTWSAWQPYAATVPATLPGGTGNRTVKVEVRNRAHGTAVFGDSITLTR